MFQQVGKYVLESELGKGAMGSVWLSRHPGLNIPVAVKILDPALAAEDPDYMARFIKEGKLAASINHQNVVRVLDAGQDGPVYYLVMELIDGADAKQLVKRRGTLPVEEVLELAICTAEALSEAHKAGIVHRDIKPDNILITSKGQVKLADLGIAKQLNDDYGTTIAGTTIGTPFYIAPEQAYDSSTVDTRCDIYALGGTLYHLLTGSVPFTGPSAMAILMKHGQEELQHPKERKADLPDNICNVVCKMMEKKPENRYQSCQELLKDLYRVRDNKSTAPSSKKKKFKAPAKKGSTPSKARESEKPKPSIKNVSKRSSNDRRPAVKKKPLGAIFIVAAILLVAAGVFLFKPKPVSAEAKNVEKSESSKAPDFNENSKKIEPKKSSNKTALDIIKKLERDNPGLSISSERVQMSDEGLRVNLGDTKIKNISSLKGYPVKFLHLNNTRVENFSVLKELPTQELDLSMIKKTVSLKSLNYKTIKWLRLMMTNLKDLDEFKKFDLHYLAVKQHRTITAQIKHMSLYRFDMDNADLQIIFENLNKSSLRELRLHMAKGVKTISKLKGFKLKVFHLTESPCADLSVLKGMPLEDVALMGTSVKDLNFLKNAPEKRLILNYRCETVEVLKSLKTLQQIAIPGKLWGPEIEFLRKTNVEIEGYRNKKEHWWLHWGNFQKLNSDKFWKDYDEYRRSQK